MNNSEHSELIKFADVTSASSYLQKTTKPASVSTLMSWPSFVNYLFLCVVLVVAACYLGHVKNPWLIDWLIDWLAHNFPAALMGCGLRASCLGKSSKEKITDKWFCNCVSLIQLSVCYHAQYGDRETPVNKVKCLWLANHSSPYAKENLQS